MPDEKCTWRRVEVASYDDVWERTKKKTGYTDKQLREKLQEFLQLYAWADIFGEIVESWEDEQRQ